MPVKNIEKDLDACTMTVTCEFDAPIQTVWQIWSDPRKLERWWGPPSYPATVTEHSLTPGEQVKYYMTGPEGERYHGWWRIKEANPPERFAIEDGFADENGNPNFDLPVTRMNVELTAHGDERTTMVLKSTFASTEAMQQVIDMGMEEGLQQALGQIEDIIAG